MPRKCQEKVQQIISVFKYHPTIPNSLLPYRYLLIMRLMVLPNHRFCHSYILLNEIDDSEVMTIMIINAQKVKL